MLSRTAKTVKTAKTIMKATPLKPNPPLLSSREWNLGLCLGLCLRCPPVLSRQGQSISMWSTVKAAVLSTLGAFPTKTVVVNLASRTDISKSLKRNLWFLVLGLSGHFQALSAILREQNQAKSGALFCMILHDLP